MNNPMYKSTDLLPYIEGAQVELVYRNTNGDFLIIEPSSGSYLKRFGDYRLETIRPRMDVEKVEGVKYIATAIRKSNDITVYIRTTWNTLLDIILLTDMQQEGEFIVTAL